MLRAHNCDSRDSQAEETPAVECALARNAFTKRELTRDFTKNLPAAALAKRPPCTQWHKLPFSLPVFTVSAVEYQKLSSATSPRAASPRDEDAAQVFTSAAQTEMPALGRFLRYAALAHHRRGLEVEPRGALLPGPIGAALLECIHAPAEGAASGGGSSSGGAAAAGASGEPWASLATKDLKAALVRAGVDVSSCLERADVAALARRHPEAFAGSSGGGGGGGSGGGGDGSHAQAPPPAAALAKANSSHDPPAAAGSTSDASFGSTGGINPFGGAAGKRAAPEAPAPSNKKAKSKPTAESVVIDLGDSD